MTEGGSGELSRIGKNKGTVIRIQAAGGCPYSNDRSLRPVAA